MSQDPLWRSVSRPFDWTRESFTCLIKHYFGGVSVMLFLEYLYLVQETGGKGPSITKMDGYQTILEGLNGTKRQKKSKFSFLELGHSILSCPSTCLTLCLETQTENNRLFKPHIWQYQGSLQLMLMRANSYNKSLSLWEPWLTHTPKHVPTPGVSRYSDEPSGYKDAMLSKEFAQLSWKHRE